MCYIIALIYDFNKFEGNPFWNQLLIAGFRGATPFLGYVDLIGTAYEENFIATGSFCSVMSQSDLPNR